MITQDELEMFVDECIEPIYVAEASCDGDACQIDFGGNDDTK